MRKVLQEIAGKNDRDDSGAAMVHRKMPTKADLERLGESALVQAIMSAGGFLVVAQKLGLRTQRKPSGFWEDINNLDEVRDILKHTAGILRIVCSQDHSAAVLLLTWLRHSTLKCNDWLVV